MTKEPTGFSPEELISQALMLHSQGDITEAAKLYQLFLDKGFTDLRVFSNYAMIYAQIGQTEQAINSFFNQ